MRPLPEVRWERMLRHELEAAFERCPAVYFAYGLCEPHGPQNALGLDALKAHGILVKLAREHGGIVAPPDFWHVHELQGYGTWAHQWVGELRPWLTAVPPWVHFKSVCYQLRAAEVLGFRVALLLTGHYGPNWQDLKSLLDRLQPYLRMRLYGLPDFEVNQPGFDGDGAAGDHAGKVETSLLWALEPECVDVSRIEEVGERPFFAMGPDAARASRAIGERMVEDEVRNLVARRSELLAAYDPQVQSRLRTFDDVERFWRDQVRPALKDFKSMQNFASGEPPPGSRWRENFEVGDWG
ncbi:MAG: creatininase family protein [Gemmatimonadota bacterium]